MRKQMAYLGIHMMVQRNKVVCHIRYMISEFVKSSVALRLGNGLFLHAPLHFLGTIIATPLSVRGSLLAKPHYQTLHHSIAIATS